MLFVRALSLSGSDTSRAIVLAYLTYMLFAEVKIGRSDRKPAFPGGTISL